MIIASSSTNYKEETLNWYPMRKELDCFLVGGVCNMLPCQYATQRRAQTACTCCKTWQSLLRNILVSSGSSESSFSTVNRWTEKKTDPLWQQNSVRLSHRSSWTAFFAYKLLSQFFQNRFSCWLHWAVTPRARAVDVLPLALACASSLVGELHPTTSHPRLEADSPRSSQTRAESRSVWKQFQHKKGYQMMKSITQNSLPRAILWPRCCCFHRVLTMHALEVCVSRSSVCKYVRTIRWIYKLQFVSIMKTAFLQLF